jgi:hypothetical protein
VVAERRHSVVQVRTVVLIALLAIDRLGHALLADAEIASGTFGLRPPKSIGWHLDGSEGVTFGAGLAHVGRQMTENKEQSKDIGK